MKLHKKQVRLSHPSSCCQILKLVCRKTKSKQWIWLNDLFRWSFFLFLFVMQSSWLIPTFPNRDAHFQHVLHVCFRNEHWHPVLHKAMPQLPTPGGRVCRTRCKCRANPGLWGRLVTGYVGTLENRHRKSEAFTSQLAHVYNSYQCQPGRRFDLSAMSESQPGIATSGSDRDCCAQLPSPRTPFGRAEGGGQREKKPTEGG